MQPHPLAPPKRQTDEIRVTDFQDVPKVPHEVREISCSFSHGPAQELRWSDLGRSHLRQRYEHVAVPDDKLHVAIAKNLERRRKPGGPPLSFEPVNSRSKARVLARYGDPDSFFSQRGRMTQKVRQARI